MLGKPFQQSCNHEICTTTLLFITKCWGVQNTLCLPLSKRWGGNVPPVPPLNSGLAQDNKSQEIIIINVFELIMVKNAAICRQGRTQGG